MKPSLILLTALSCVSALTPKYQRLPSLREQAKLQDAWTAERKEAIPALLAKYGVDAWIVRLFRHFVFVFASPFRP